MRKTGPILWTIAIILLVSSAVQAKSVDVKLGEQGGILAWLVVGPFPNEGKQHDSCEGFDYDYLSASGGEVEAKPVEGDVVQLPDETKASWKPVLVNIWQWVDFLASCRTRKPAVAYAYAVIESKSDRDLKLLLGSDDGVKVWVNGKLCHTAHVERGVKWDEDQVPVHLNKGENRLLFKVDQGTGGWALTARLTEPDGKPAKDLVQRLDVSPQAKASSGPLALTMCRILNGKPGKLDVASVMEYEANRKKAIVWLRAFGGKTGKPDVLAQILDAERNRIDNASKKNADAVSAAMAVANKNIKSEYDKARTKVVNDIQNPKPLFDVDPAKEDYAGVAPEGRYFIYAGRPFIPLGYNHNPDWSKFFESDPSREGYNPKVTEEFFAHLKKSGVNLVRLMIETPQSGCLEKPIGTFRPEHVRWIDHIVTFARKENIKLTITPWDTFWMNHGWDICPYNSKLGGPVAEKIDFITKPEVKEAQKKRLKFIIDRWGNLGDIFCWELINEGDIWWGASPEQLGDWVREMASFVRDYEKRKWGRNHMLSFSTAHAMPGGALADAAYRLEGMDFATTHLYIGVSKAPTEAIGPALTTYEGVSYALKNIKDRRPYMDSENGPIDKWISDGKFDDEVFHNMSWSHLASGGAGSGLRWPYRHPHHLSEEMYKALSYMSKFAEQAPWAKICSRGDGNLKVDVPEDRIAVAYGSPKAIILWTAAKTGAVNDLQLKVMWTDEPGRVNCKAFDTKTGAWHNPEATVAGREVTVDMKNAPASAALILESEKP